LDSLPEDIQRRARAAYARWHENPSHPSLQYKKVHETQPVYSVRIGLGWRALGLLQGDAMIWFWIGPHSEYDRRVERMRRR
jgi:hypothetical protein